MTTMPDARCPLVYLAKDQKCQHTKVMPTFDEEAARGLDAHEVRKRWPRFDGVCPDCKESWIMYASLEHMVMGDW